MDFENSEAFKIFLQEFKETSTEIHAMNPVNGLVAGEKWDDAPLNNKNIANQTAEEGDRRIRVRQSFLKSAIVKTVVVFESYINDLFSEAFELTQWENRGSPEGFEYRWPAGIQLVKKLISNYSRDDKRKDEFYQIARDYDVWSYLLQKHRDDTLSDVGPTIISMRMALRRLFALEFQTASRLPVQASEEGDDGNRKCRPPVKSQVRELTMAREASPAAGTSKESGPKTPQKPKTGKNCKAADKQEESKQSASKFMNLSEFPLETMVKNGTFNVLWQIPSSSGGQCFSRLVTIDNLDAVTHILNLFYAIRCITVHGKFQATLDGCLKYFPGEPEELKIGDSVVEKYVYNIYSQIRNNALTVDYHLCLNVTRFVKSTAHCLQKALGYFIYYQLRYNEDKPAYRKFWGLKMYAAGMDVPWGKTLHKEKEDVGSAGALAGPSERAETPVELEETTE